MRTHLRLARLILTYTMSLFSLFPCHHNACRRTFTASQMLRDMACHVTDCVIGSLHFASNIRLPTACSSRIARGLVQTSTPAWKSSYLTCATRSSGQLHRLFRSIWSQRLLHLIRRVAKFSEGELNSKGPQHLGCGQVRRAWPEAWDLLSTPRQARLRGLGGRPGHVVPMKKREDGAEMDRKWTPENRKRGLEFPGGPRATVWPVFPPNKAISRVCLRQSLSAKRVSLWVIRGRSGLYLQSFGLELARRFVRR